MELTVVENINNGVKINEIFQKWNNIKSAKQHTEWETLVANTNFGTYYNKKIIDIFDNFRIGNCNSRLRLDFINECRRAIN